MVPGNIPRHSFITWLAILNKLSTHDRIMLYTRGPLACVLCHTAMETHDHLFFKCSYSSFIWQGFLVTMDLSHPVLSWNSFVNWASKAWKQKKPQLIIQKMCLGMAVYSIWKERNARSFKFEAKSKERVFQEITRQISTQIQIKWRDDPILPSLIARWS